ncbi:MAG: HupE/UreJ family protein, partial [Longimicrobiales bacterium]
MTAWRALPVGAAVLALAAVSPEHLAAHEGGTVAGLLSGLQHPLSGADHMLAMVAVGVWGAQLGAPSIWALPVTFPVVMALGGAVGLLGLDVPGVEVGIALSALLLGVMVATEASLDHRVAAALVGLFALFHG